MQVPVGYVVPTEADRLTTTATATAPIDLDWPRSAWSRMCALVGDAGRSTWRSLPSLGV